MHADELDVDEGLVRRLVRRDFPSMGELSVQRVAVSGSSNSLFRLGTELLVRLPRQPGAGSSIITEARWVPQIEQALPVSVPEFVASGKPGFGYPEHWAITRWIDGNHPRTPEPAGSVADELACDLAGLLRALHMLDVPAAALKDPQLHGYRGQPLERMDVEVRSYLADCRELPDLDLDLDACEQVWEHALGLPRPDDAPPRWLHGDLLAENLLMRDDRLCAVLDFGALAIGDPTVDLVVAWEVLAPAAREVFRGVLDVDELTWLRGRAWALVIALMTFPYYWRSMPDRCAARLAMAEAVLDDYAGSATSSG